MGEEVINTLTEPTAQNVSITKRTSIVSRLQNSLHSLDFFGQEFHLRMRGFDSFKTALGSLFTIICFTLIFFGLYLTIRDVQDTERPVSTISEKVTPTYPLLDLYNDSHVPAFGIIQKSSAGVQFLFSNSTDAYLTPQVEIYEQGEEGGDIDTWFAVKKRIVVPVIPCSQITGTKITDKVKEDKNAGVFLLKFGLCPHFEDKSIWYVQGKLSQPPFRFIKLNLYPCSLPNPADCKPLKDIVILNAIVGILNKLVDLSSKDEPINSSTTFDFEYQVNPGLETKSTFFFNQNRILDDDRDFFDPRITQSFTTIDEVVTQTGFRDYTSLHCTAESVADGSCQPYLSIEFRAGSKIKTFQRTYLKLVEQLAEYGGFIQAALLIFSLIYYFYNQYFFKSYLKKEMLVFEEDIYKVFFTFRKSGKRSVTTLVDKLISGSTDAVNLCNNRDKLEMINSMFLTKEQHLLVPLINHIHKTQEKEDPEYNLQLGGTREGVHRRELCSAYSMLQKQKSEHYLGNLLVTYMMGTLPTSFIERLGFGRSGGIKRTVNGGLKILQRFEGTGFANSDGGLKKAKKLSWNDSEDGSHEVSKKVENKIFLGKPRNSKARVRKTKHQAKIFKKVNKFSQRSIQFQNNAENENANPKKASHAHKPKSTLEVIRPVVKQQKKAKSKRRIETSSKRNIIDE